MLKYMNQYATGTPPNQWHSGTIFDTLEEAIQEKDTWKGPGFYYQTGILNTETAQWIFKMLP